MQFGNFDIDSFLRDYWQKKPLLIRNPWREWESPLEPDELGGLACEEGVESRLVTQAAGNWKLEHGPFAEQRLTRLGPEPWTLLVQAADHFVPQVAGLIEPFRFIPDWRIDDVMISCASDGGGVGPHFDHYDVFLVQGLGRRRWQIGALCDDDTPLLPHGDLRLLADFAAEAEWVLEPGDMLYVPPGIAHNGAAVGDDCMTYSIGFRAPSRADLIGHWCDDLLEHMPEDDRYRDPALAMQENPGEITAGAVAQLHQMVTDKLADRGAFARWFGAYNTAPKYPETDWQPETPVTAGQLRAILADGAVLLRNPASRFSFIQEGADSTLLFVDGECFECAGVTAKLAQHICAQTEIEIAPEITASQEAADLLVLLVNHGSLAPDQGD